MEIDGIMNSTRLKYLEIFPNQRDKSWLPSLQFWNSFSSMIEASLNITVGLGC